LEPKTILKLFLYSSLV